MLQFRYSPPFFSFPFTIERNPYEWKVDTLRYLHFNITVAELTYHTCIRQLCFGNPIETYSGTIDDYQTMILVLKCFRDYLITNVETLDIGLMVGTKIILNDSKEILCITHDENLRRIINDKCSEKGQKFRTIHPQTTTNQFA